MGLNGLSGDAKTALARDVPEAAHCRDALRAGLAYYGARALPDGRFFVTHRPAVARLYRALTPASHVEQQATRRLARLPRYRIALDAPPDEPPKPAHRCDRVMEVRAAFLACGSLSATASGYHLEWVPPDERAATRLEWMVRAILSPPKRARRKGRTVVYFKDFEAIVGLLTVIGAHSAVLRLEDVHALKETKNRIHRLVNTEAANLDRAVAAAAGHRETIEFLESAYGLAKLSPPLREIATLRLLHPDESLAELGRRCAPPVTKPTVNSRLAALARLARRLRGETLHANRKG